MNDYSRGYAAGLKAAAKAAKQQAKYYVADHHTSEDVKCAHACSLLAQQILSLPIVGEATNPGEQAESPSVSDGQVETPRASSLPPARPGPSQECVSVPREPKKGLLCGDVAISTDPRYAGWVFVRHVDGINWTTGAKLTPETWAMLAAREE